MPCMMATLGITAELQSNDQLNYRTVAKRYPTSLDAPEFAKVSNLGEQNVHGFDLPGLYQVLIRDNGAGNFTAELSRAMPVTDVAFLTKVLHLDIPAVMTRLLLDKFSGKLLTESMDATENINQAAIYRALFPFKALGINEVPTAGKVSGAEMQFLD